MGAAKLELRYDRELIGAELDDLVAQHPSQVHRVPGCINPKGFWFEIEGAPTGGHTLGARAFCICAKTREDAEDYATILATALSREIGRELAGPTE